MRDRLPIPFAMMTLALIAGCENVPDEPDVVADAPPLLAAYAAKPAPGTIVALPPVPLFPSRKETDVAPLLLNADFEQSGRFWAMSGSDLAECTVTDILSGDGRHCLQALPSPGGEVFISQTIDVMPSTFYAFSALVFAPGNSELNLEVRDPRTGAVLTSHAISGPLTAWSRVAIAFVTGVQTDMATVGFRCIDRADNAPVLIDHCEFYALPAKNSIPDGRMETAPEEGKTPLWYAAGRPSVLVPGGYQTTSATELPLLMYSDSSLVYFVPDLKDLQGRSVWISAMVRCEADDEDVIPGMTLGLKATQADGNRTDVSAEFPATREWKEFTVRVTIPKRSAEVAANMSAPDLLFITAPKGYRGRVLIDDVSMFAIPRGDFVGGLAPKPSSN